jgi:flagellin-like hook-associated protein FlgL
MATIPANLARVPSFLASRLATTSIGRTSAGLLRVQNELATGNRIARVSDDPIRASGVLAINDRLGLSAQRLRNLDRADSVLGTLDAALGDANTQVLAARDLASTQIGLLSDPAQRAAMVSQVDSIIQSVAGITNRETLGVYLFGGSTPGTRPLLADNGAFRFVAQGSGLLPDLGMGDAVPVTIGGANALGELSARQRSTTTLSPNLDAATQLADLRGARGLGVTLGPISLSINAGPPISIDLAGAASVTDVSVRLTAAIRQYEADTGTTVLGPGTINVVGQGFFFDVAGGTMLSFVDGATSTAAADLGLSQLTITSVNPLGQGVSPRLTPATPIGAIPGVTTPLGTIRLRQVGPGSAATFRDVDLAGAISVDEVRQRIEGAGLGARVRINQSGSGLDIYNEVSGRTLSVEDVPGGDATALELGIRTFFAGTPVAAFNGGRGVGVVDGVINGATGAVDPTLNSDLRITLGNGQWFDVDLRPQDMTTVQSVLDRINQQFAGAVGSQNNPGAPALAAGQFSAGLVDAGGGLALTQTVGGGAIAVGELNNSPAAEALGLRSLTLDATSGAHVGEDRAGLRVDNVLTALIELRTALQNGSSSGITLAGEALQRATDRLQAAQGVVGGLNRRVDEQKTLVSDQELLDERIKSELIGTDYTEASVRLNQLSTQLEATLATTARTQGRTLFDFLR